MNHLLLLPVLIPLLAGSLLLLAGRAGSAVERSIGVVATAALVLVAVLLLVRTGIVSRPVDPASIAPAMPAGPLGQSERWMAILQGNRRIGTTHSRLEPTEDGYRLTETVSMRINTMGLVQDLALDSRGWLNSDLTLARFSFTMQSGLFRFAAEGFVEDDALICRIQSGDEDQQLRIPIAAPPYLPAGIFPAVGNAGLAAGERRDFHIFDPSTLAQEKITLAIQGRETLQLGSRSVEALKVALEFKGISQEAWLDDNGQILMEKGLLGIRQERISREEALSGQPLTARPKASSSMLRLPKASSTAPGPTPHCSMARCAVV